MNKFEHRSLLSSLEEVGKSLFTVIGKKKAQDWALDRANGVPTADPDSPNEKLFEDLFQLCKVCHKQIVKLDSSENLFSEVSQKKA